MLAIEILNAHRSQADALAVLPDPGDPGSQSPVRLTARLCTDLPEERDHRRHESTHHPRPSEPGGLDEHLQRVLGHRQDEWSELLECQRFHTRQIHGPGPAG
ncbi:hypothetical protein ACWELB_47815 [Streptomyces asiaticus]|uniref:hypothetical protein n=1 Tax=Streptomyces asiaticus TaxID=114695 RepID=UPI003D721D2D